MHNKINFCVILLPCCNTRWYTKRYGWQQGWQQPHFSAILLEKCTICALFGVSNHHFHTHFEHRKWEIPLFDATFLPLQSEFLRRILSFHERNASISGTKCKHSRRGMQAIYERNRSNYISGLIDLKNKRKWDKQPHFRWFCKSKILGFKMLFNSTTILSQRTVDECICKEGVTT